MLRAEAKSSIVESLWTGCGAASEKLRHFVRTGRSVLEAVRFSAHRSQAIPLIPRGVGFVIPVFSSPYYYCLFKIPKRE